MNHDELQIDDHELDPLTDSLASRVRWRTSDYAAIFRAELDLMLASDNAAKRRSGGAVSRLREAR